MKNFEEMDEEFRRTDEQFKKAFEIFDEKMRAEFLNSSKEEALSKLRDYATPDLVNLKDYALPIENYELCHLVQLVLQERGYEQPS